MAMDCVVAYPIDHLKNIIYIIILKYIIHLISNDLIHNTGVW